MSTGDAFRTLSDLIQDLETSGCEVTAVDAPDGEMVTDEAVDARVAVSFPVFEGEGNEDVAIEVATFELGEDGTARAELSVSVEKNENGEPASSRLNGDRSDPEIGSENWESNARGGPDVAAQSNGESADTEGGEPNEKVTETNDVEADEEDTGDGTPEDAQVGSAVPDHRDPERLREVYERYDTFAEMTDALGTDVTAQTVRHHMIKHGIHEPTSQSDRSTSDTEVDDIDPVEPDEASEPVDGEPTDRDEPEPPNADAASEPKVEDTPESAGSDERPEDDLPELVDLPDGIELEDVKRAVRSSSTLFEVQRKLDVDRERTRELLRELGLLEFVTGRLAKKRNQDSSLERIDGGAGSTEEIDERIRAAVASGASS